MFDDFIPPHEGEDGSAVLVEGGRFGLVEVGSQVLRIDRQYLISSDIEIGLQFLYLCEIGFVVPHIDLRHYLSVVVAKLCVNLWALLLEELGKDFVFREDVSLHDLNVGLRSLQKAYLFKEKLSQPH